MRERREGRVEWRERFWGVYIPQEKAMGRELRGERFWMGPLEKDNRKKQVGESEKRGIITKENKA